MTSRQIKTLKSSLKKANDLEIRLRNQQKKLASLIEDYTGVTGYVDHLQGDGFGFTPKSNNDTHIGVSDIIKFAEQGVVLTEEVMLANLYF